MSNPKWSAWKFPLVMSALTTLVVTFVLVSINYGFGPSFVFLWMRSWLVAGCMVALSIRFVGPRVRKWLD
jgi:hypothetical protein